MKVNKRMGAALLALCLMLQAVPWALAVGEPPKSDITMLTPIEYNYIAQEVYSKAPKFQSDLVTAGKDGRYGSLNRNGEVAIPLQFNAPYTFVNGVAVVSNDEGKTIINTAGEHLVKPGVYDDVRVVGNGLVVLGVGEQCNLYNLRTGVTIAETINGQIYELDVNPSVICAMTVNPDGKTIYNYMDGDGNSFTPAGTWGKNVHFLDRDLLIFTMNDPGKLKGIYNIRARSEVVAAKYTDIQKPYTHTAAGIKGTLPGGQENDYFTKEGTYILKKTSWTALLHFGSEGYMQFQTENQDRWGLYDPKTKTELMPATYFNLTSYDSNYNKTLYSGINEGNLQQKRFFVIENGMVSYKFEGRDWSNVTYTAEDDIVIYRDAKTNLTGVYNLKTEQEIIPARYSNIAEFTNEKHVEYFSGCDSRSDKILYDIYDVTGTLEFEGLPFSYITRVGSNLLRFNHTNYDTLVSTYGLYRIDTKAVVVENGYDRLTQIPQLEAVRGAIATFNPAKGLFDVAYTYFDSDGTKIQDVAAYAAGKGEPTPILTEESGQPNGTNYYFVSATNDDGTTTAFSGLYFPMIKQICGIAKDDGSDGPIQLLTPIKYSQHHENGLARIKDPKLSDGLLCFQFVDTTIYLDQTTYQVKGSLDLETGGLSQGIGLIKENELYGLFKCDITGSDPTDPDPDPDPVPTPPPGGGGSSGGGSPTEKPSPTPMVPTVSTDYLYDTTDPGATVKLPTEKLDTITDAASATKVISDLTGTMTDTQKTSPTGIDLATLFAEEAVAASATGQVKGGQVVINAAAISELQKKAVETLQAVQSALIDGGISTARYVNNTVTLETAETGAITIRIDPDVLGVKVDKIRVQTPSYAITVKLSEIAETLNADNLYTILAQDVGTGFAPDSNSKTTTVKLTLPNGKTKEPITISLPRTADDTTYQAVVKTSGEATASKHNPATNRMEARVTESATYTVKTNKKDFSDIANRNAEMQNAIRYLASKGIIDGTTATTFSPDESISRAETAALLMRALGKLDSSASNTFMDVKTSDWYYGAAGSSQKHNIINGFSDGRFMGGTTIAKEQIVAVTARVLRMEMGYKMPATPQTYLSKYSDSIVDWAQPDVALATRENVVIYRTDGMFRGGESMTRGDAAVIIYRMFQKIW